LAAVLVRAQEQGKLEYKEAQDWLQHVRELAATIPGVNREWEYLDYADGSQDPLASDGPDSAQKLREVNKKYDSEQFFPRLVIGGFDVVNSNLAKE
jgi:hypothetical protein